MASKNPPQSRTSKPQMPESRDDRPREDTQKADETTRNANEGEGNKSADRHYREATKAFINSPRGKEEIERAGDVSAIEERDIEEAEEAAKNRAREHDPQEVRDRR